MQIQKQIFFIWLGDNKPNYVDFAIKAFQNVNPNFKIDLIRYTLSEIDNWENSNDFILRKTIKKILSKKIHINQHIPLENKYIIQHICDVYRFEILQYYGGIYLDCDTFPIKPFDDKLLEMENFNVKRQSDNQKTWWLDSFFCGQSDPKYYLRLDRDKINHLDGYYNSFEKDPKFIELKKKFFNCTLSYGEYFGDPNCYINHYHEYRWNLNNYKVEICNLEFL